jgi:hypothetical protein
MCHKLWIVFLTISGIVGLAFLSLVLAKAPMVGSVALTAGFIWVFRTIWLGLLAFFGFATVYEYLNE